MTRPSRASCNRTWEAEALIDGRLAPNDRASFERHAKDCTTCTGELEHLRELGALLGALPEEPRSELERRRARADLLRRANEAFVGGGATTKVSARLAWVAVLAVAALVLLFLRTRAPSPSPLVATPPRAEIVDVGRAVFEEERIGTTSRVTLRSGAASFHVEHVQTGARFLVAVPDGEVEVRGTRFVVDVAGGHTRSVTVTEGAVAVRVAGFEGLLLAGERWPKATTSPAPTSEPGATPAPSAPLEPATPAPLTTRPVASASAASPSAAIAPRAAQSGGSPDPAGAGARFARAMSAFDAGDYGSADNLFGAFARDFPRDSRAEDALYLRADARARRGDRGGAAAAAREYLQRFPRGFRSVEASRLAELR